MTLAAFAGTTSTRVWVAVGVGEAPSLGVLMFAVVSLHNLPEGFTMAVLAAMGRWRSRICSSRAWP